MGADQPLRAPHSAIEKLKARRPCFGDDHTLAHRPRAIDGARTAQNGAIANTISITVRSVAGEPYDRIVDYELGPLPEPVPAEVLEVYEESSDELPF